MEQHHALVLTTLLLIVFAPSTSVTKQANHNLEWNVEEGTRATYVLQRKNIRQAVIENPNDYSFSLHYEFSIISDLAAGSMLDLVVSDLDSIPENIVDIEDMPKSHCVLSKDNGSRILGTDLSSFVIPVGDWLFLNETLEGYKSWLVGSTYSYWEVIHIDTESEWGIIIEDDFGGSKPPHAFYTELRYWKENGTLSYYRDRYIDLLSPSQDAWDIILASWHPGVPTILIDDTQNDLLIPIAAGIAITLGVLVILRYRFRK